MLRYLPDLVRGVTNIAVFAALFAFAWLAGSDAAYAQSTTSYVRTDDGRIDEDQACNASPLIRTFSVGDSFIVGDVDLGVIVDHSWRGDLRIRLTSPAGTMVQLTNGDINAISGNNFNVLLDDEGTRIVNTDGDRRDHSGANSPPFQNNFIPVNPLSAFDGENSAGTWTMEICDLFPSQDDGDFRYAELFLTPLPANTADLSLTKSVSNASPAFGATVRFTLALENIGPSSTTNVEVLDQLPAGFGFTSSSGFGSYDPVTGIWSVGTIGAGQTRTLTITGTVEATAGATITNFAQVFASDESDPDSTPGNGFTGEDDDDSASFTVQGPRIAGTPPVLSCPVGTRILDWDASGVAWSAGGFNQSFTVADFGEVGFALSSDGTWVNDPTFGGLSPAESDANTGGSASSGNSLHQYLDFANRQQTATTVITLPNAVSGAQFTIFDVDFAPNDFADLVTVTGTYQGASVIPTLTNGSANYVVGNSAIGDVTSGNSSGAGNIVVTFAQPIDTITIVYGNAPTAPPVPDGQAIAIHDITFCAPQTQLSITKVSSIIEDPFNPDAADAKAIPGATVEYVIQVSNTGISATDPGELVITDFHAADITLCRLDRAGGPITFSDPGASTGLTYSEASDLAYSQVGDAGFGYTPQDDGTGCDPDIDDFRLTPGGMMAGGSSFELRVRYRIIE
jgi:uncharacterized repeat protein (TIGR01451 family)